MAHDAPRPRPAHPAFAGGQAAAPRTRRSFTVALVALIAVPAILLGAAPVQASPSVAEIEKQIDQEWNKLEPVIEKHNAVQQDLAKKKKAAQALAKQIQPLQDKLDKAVEKVGEFASRAYKGDDASTFNALIAGSPETLVDRLELLDQFARKQQADVRAVREARDQYLAKKTPLDALVARLGKTEAQLAAQKKQIDTEIKRLEKLRIKAYGTSGSLGSLRPAPCPSDYLGDRGTTVAKFACAQIGKPYVWGAAGPDAYDCSGLMLAAWAKVGVSLPHNAAAQRQATAYVKRADLRPGDLVFYYSDIHHVGMYVGNGWVVHASQAGVPIKMKRMDDGPIHSFGRPE